MTRILGDFQTATGSIHDWRTCRLVGVKINDDGSLKLLAKQLECVWKSCE